MKYCVGKEDSYIFKKGDTSVSFYIILEGICQAEREGSKKVLGKGAYFGDLGLLHNYPRSASIFVKEACLLASLDKEKFLKAQRKLNSLNEEENYKIISAVSLFS